MQARFATAVLLGFVLIGAAACGGGISQAELDEAEAARAAAEQAQQEAEAAAAEAERRRQAEAAAREEAEEEAAEAEQQRQEEEAARQAAEEAAQEAEEERLAAEAEASRLEAEAEERRKADALERARTAIAGHTATTGPLAALVVDTDAIEYGEPAPVTTPPGPFTTTSGRSGSWSTTSLTANQEPTRDMVQIYTDVEPDTSEPFRTSPLNTEDVGPTGTTTVIDGTGDVIGWVEIMNAAGGDDNHSRIAASGSFPREIGNPKPFSLVDRFHSQDEFNALTWDDDSDGVLDQDEEDILDTAGVTRQKFLQYIAGNGFRNTSVFPERYAYTTSGTLQGAGGTYRCDGATATATCTVQNRGGSFEFDGDWDFIPSSGTVQIVVPDAEYMWFGVWARQTVRLATPPEQPTELWRFDARHGGTHAVSDLSAATGSATYTGPAAGRYAVYEPDTGDSNIGSFTASAELRADFDSATNTVSGSITNFSNDPSWSLALKRKDISGGAVAAVADSNSVTWTIDGVQDDSGDWEAQFYNNLPATTVTYQPHGIAGTFEAAYDPSGVGARAAVIGGFGAHR